MLTPQEPITEERKPQASADALNALLVSYKSTLSDLSLRAKQAEDFAAILMTEKLTPDQMMALVTQTLGVQFETRKNERAVHQQALIQTTLLTLSALGKRVKNLTPEEIHKDLETMIQALTLAVSFEELPSK